MLYKTIKLLSKQIEKNCDGQPLFFIAQDGEDFMMIWDGNEELAGLIRDAMDQDPMLAAVIKSAAHEDFSDN